MKRRQQQERELEELLRQDQIRQIEQTEKSLQDAQLSVKESHVSG